MLAKYDLIAVKEPHHVLGYRGYSNSNNQGVIDKMSAPYYVDLCFVQRRNTCFGASAMTRLSDMPRTGQASRRAGGKRAARRRAAAGSMTAGYIASPLPEAFPATARAHVSPPWAGDPRPRCLSRSKAASYLGISEDLFERLCRHGDLPARPGH